MCQLRATNAIGMAVTLSLVTSSLACARQAVPHVDSTVINRSWSQPVPRFTSDGWRGPASLPQAPEPRDPVFSNGNPSAPPASGVAPPRTVRRLDASTIPDGPGCVRQLKSLGVVFREGPKKEGLKTPVVVEGSLGGVVYRGLRDAPLLCDCRLAVALSWVGPDLLAVGISELFFSGAYSYRMSRVGRLSLHAYGLAIDVHEATADGVRVRVTHDYERWLPNSCLSSRALNQAACRLGERGMFRELLTPDYDADHHDHLHFSIEPHGEDLIVRKRELMKSTPEVGRCEGKHGKQRAGPRRTTNHGTRGVKLTKHGASVAVEVAAVEPTGTKLRRLSKSKRRPGDRAASTEPAVSEVVAPRGSGKKKASKASLAAPGSLEPKPVRPERKVQTKPEPKNHKPSSEPVESTRPPPARPGPDRKPPAELTDASKTKSKPADPKRKAKPDEPVPDAKPAEPKSSAAPGA